MPLFQKKIEASTEFLNAANSIIDSSSTTQKARGQLKNEFSNLFANVQMYIAEQVTTRHQTDMQSKSWLSRNIRPMSLLIVIFAFIFSHQIGLAPEQSDRLWQGTELILKFYFGSKVLEQGVPLISNFTKSLRRKG